MFKRNSLIFIAIITLQVIKGQTSIDSLTINPNPFQKRTSVNFSFINNDTVSIIIYNTIGNIVLSPITNSVMSSGSYQDSLIMDAYPDGLYFVHLILSHRKTITKKIIKSNTAGISNHQMEIENLKVYPNPFKDKLTIEFSNNINSLHKIKIFDNFGQCLHISENLNSKVEIDLLLLLDGLYHLRIEGIPEQNNFKIIKE